MKKTKKNKAKAGKKSILSGATKTLRKLGKGTGLGRLSTSQKVVGGTALVALGLTYLAKHLNDSAASPHAAAAENHPSSHDGSALA